MEIFVVLSRDTDFIYCTTDKQKAEGVRKHQEIEEEMSGGRPSVYILTTTLN